MRLVIVGVFFSAIASAQSSDRASRLPAGESAGVAGSARVTAPSSYKPLPEDDTPPPASTEKPRWYGWQTLVLDVPAVSLMVLARTMEDGESAAIPFSMGFPVYVFGAPFVHAAHHRRQGIVAASFGMRLGAPLVVSLLGAAASASDCDDGHCGLDEALTFAVVGMGIAAVLDAAVLAHEERKPAPPEGAAILSVAPSVDARRGAASLSVQGRF